MVDSNSRTDVSRRTFIKAGVTAAAGVGLPLDARGEEPEPGQKPVLPTRVLGRTGEKVSILNLGTAQGAANPRMLNAAYDAGIRYIDTADCYENGKAEKAVGKWLAGADRHKEFFVVTKDHPDQPGQWVEMVDKRLAVLRTDVIDLFFIHQLGEGFRGGGEKSHSRIPKMKAWARAADKLKKSGKVRFVGFSTHTMMSLRIALLNNAATGGWVDAIMVATDPQLVRQNAAFNKALDRCHKAGVGLISMKEMRAVADAPKFLPQFEEMGLTTHQAVLHAVWSDERFTSICSAMPNLKILTENSEAARKFKTMPKKEIGAVIELYERYASGFCNGCDGRCARAAGTTAALGDITRALSYYERDGARDEGRKLYASLTSEQRDWHGADLAAASQRCLCKLDFASLLARADQKLA